jgi:Tol biopolymer transport system component
LNNKKNKQQAISPTTSDINSVSTLSTPSKTKIPTVNKFYFSSNRYKKHYEIYYISDGNLKQITNDPKYDSWWPRVSPLKDKMIFYRSPTKNKNNNYEQAELWEMKLDGKEQKKLIKLSDYQWNAQGVVNWSPDGKRLVMAAIDGISNRWHIFITDNNGDKKIQISKRKSLYLDPSFSPDGKKITCIAFPDGYNGLDLSKTEIFAMNDDGSNEQRLTNDNMRDNDPCWSPDGKEIAFETAVEPHYLLVGKWALRAVDPNKKVVRKIINDGNINTLPRWSKDSSAIYFHRLVFGGLKFRISKIYKDGNHLEYLTSEKGDYDDTDVEVVEVEH